MRSIFYILFTVFSITGMCNPARTFTVVDLSIIFSNSSLNSNTITIPIKRVNNLIVIEAKIDTIIGNFILDTGSPYLILNKTYYRGSVQNQNLLASNAVGSFMEPIMRTNVHNIAIKELFFEKLSADISDLGHIENQRGIKILGLLGINLFTSFEMIIDLNKEVLYLHKPEKNKSKEIVTPFLKSKPITKIPFKLLQNIITMDVTVSGKKLVFCLDTGAETNALSNMVPKKVIESFQVSRQTYMLGTGGSRGEVLLGTLNEITIGTKSFKNMHAAITNLEALSNGYGRTIHGILGNSFLVKGIVSINFVTKELSLYPYDINNP